MSRRRKTPLDLEMSNRGLVRFNEALRRMRISREMYYALVRDGRLNPQSFEWKGQPMAGLHEHEVQRYEDQWRALLDT